MTLEELIDEKIKRLDEIPELLISNVANSEKDILKKVLEKLDSIERNRGKIIISSKNVTIINEIINELPKIVTSSDYKFYVKEFIKEFDVEKEITDSILKEAIEKAIIKDIQEDIIGVYKKKAAIDLIGSNSITAVFSKPIQSILTQSLVNGESYIDMSEKIRNIVVGNKDVDGVLTRYSKQIASDLYSGNDRAYTEAISNENNIEFYRYAGRRIKTTRRFCKERLEMYWHIKEVKQWGNINNWQGRISGTNSNNIFVNLGGHNCRHSLIPVSLFSVPKSTLQRNIKNGNLILTNKQKEILNIK